MEVLPDVLRPWRKFKEECVHARCFVMATIRVHEHLFSYLLVLVSVVMVSECQLI